MSQIFVRFGCKTIDFAVLDVLSGCRFDVFDCSVRILVGKLAVFVNREVFVDGCVELAQRNRDCKVALFEVCALRAACCVFCKRVSCRVVIVGVAVPCGICIRNESIIVGGYKHVSVVVVACADDVFAVCVLNECRTAPIARLCILSVCTVHCVEFRNGFVVEHANLEAEVDVDARRIAVEVDRDTAGVLGVGRAEFGQEFTDALENFAIAFRKHTDKVRNESFVEADCDEVVCDEQSAKHDVEDAPNICGDHTGVDFLVCRHCRNGRLCGSGRRTRTENA